MLLDVMSDLGHCLAHIGVGSKQLMMLASFPVSESRQFLGNSLEKSDNDTDGGRFHVMTELVNGGNILRAS